MKNNHLHAFILVFIVLSIFSSCRSIRQANFIERTFLLAKINDTFTKLNRVPYRVNLTKFTSTSHNSSGGSNTSRGSSIDIVVDDPTGGSFAIDDRRSVFKFLANEPSAAPYIQEFRRRKMSQRIHRYSSLGMMVAGIVVMDRWGAGENGSPTEQQRILGNTGAYMFLGGFLNWIGGGFSRAVVRRKVPMKAMYEYYFGPFPKRTPHITRAERRQLIKLFQSF